jgi:hypothetical protein
MVAVNAGDQFTSFIAMSMIVSIKNEFLFRASFIVKKCFLAPTREYIKMLFNARPFTTKLHYVCSDSPAGYVCMLFSTAKP